MTIDLPTQAQLDHLEPALGFLVTFPASTSKLYLGDLGFLYVTAEIPPLPASN